MSALADRIDLIWKIAEEYGVELTGDFPGDPDTALRRWANRLGIPARVALDLESDEEAVWLAAGRARNMRFLEDRGQPVARDQRNPLLPAQWDADPVGQSALPEAGGGDDRPGPQLALVGGGRKGGPAADR